MKLLSFLVVAACLFSTHVSAQEVKPSDASLKELMQLVNASDLLKGMDQQMDVMYGNMVQQMTKGQTVTAQQQKALDDFHGKMKDILHRQLSWDKLEPQVIQVYRDTLSQDEVDGIVVFYKTPAGQAVIKKMPLIMQATMTMMQKNIPSMMAEVQEAAKESFKDFDRKK
ncbi:DUF2059 domain-containing protein [Undibacterium sp. MH2W]|uniref:DUF2059 domain-containing protein n=1 Tax=Undibacterium sp. MH2W TaxID=3413044 RepID=UPI003BF0D505